MLINMAPFRWLLLSENSNFYSRKRQFAEIVNTVICHRVSMLLKQ